MAFLLALVVLVASKAIAVAEEPRTPQLKWSRTYDLQGLQGPLSPVVVDAVHEATLALVGDRGVLLLDGRTGNVTASYRGLEVGGQAVALDIDGDGLRQELVGHSRGLILQDGLSALHLGNGSTPWSWTPPLDTFLQKGPPVLLPTDPELLVVVSESGYLYSVDPRSGALAWRNDGIPSGSLGFQLMDRPLVVQTDTGRTGILVTSPPASDVNGTFLAPAALRYVNGDNHTTVWSVPVLFSHSFALRQMMGVASIADGRIVALHEDDGNYSNASHRMVAASLTNGTVLWETRWRGWTSMWSSVLPVVDTPDGPVAFVPQFGADPIVRVRLSDGTRYPVTLPCSGWVEQLAFVDATGDGQIDMVVAASDQGVDRLCVVALADFSLLWSYTLPGTWSYWPLDPILADIDSDGVLELVTGALGDRLIAFDLPGPPSADGSVTLPVLGVVFAVVSAAVVLVLYRRKRRIEPPPGVSDNSPETPSLPRHR